jgi:hypothetical protein
MGTLGPMSWRTFTLCLFCGLMSSCAMDPIDWTQAIIPPRSRVAVVAVDRNGKPAEQEAVKLEQILVESGLRVVDRSVLGSADYLLFCNMPRRSVCSLRLVKAGEGQVLGATQTYMDPAPLRETIHGLLQP